MSRTTNLLRRLRDMMRRDRDGELADELRFHLDMEAAALQHTGMDADSARREARRRLGGLDRYTEELRDVRGGRWLEVLWQDVRFSLRVARRFPGFTAIVVATLAFAIGASTAIFSVVNVVLLRPMPFPHPEQLVLLYAQNPDRSQPRFSVSYADYLDWRRETRSFTDIAVFAGTAPTLLGGQDPERLTGLTVSSNFFHVFGVHAARGRLFGPEDANGDASDAIVLTDGFWRRRFGADPAVIGTRMQLAGGSRTIIGILPPAFQFVGRDLDVITVLAPSSLPGVANHGQHLLQSVGRLKPGVSLAQAQQDLSAVAERVAAAHASIQGWSANVFLMQNEVSREVRTPLLVLLAAAMLVLIIGCINVANLLITRGAARGREVALRQALGASRGRLVSQLFVESSLFALAGGAIGVALAVLGTRVLLRVVPAGLIPRVDEVSVDATVLAFALGLSLATACIVGLWPAVRATSPRLAAVLRGGARAGAGSAHAPQTRRALVVAEISLALVLLICSVLMLQSLRQMLRVAPGYQVAHVMTMRVTPGAAYSDTTLVSLYRDITTRLAGRGGIEAAAAANVPPLSDGGVITPIRLIGRPTAGAERIMSSVTAVTPGYFHTTNIPLLRGRDVAWSDTRPTIVASKAAADAFWPGEDPIGERVAFGQRDTVGLEIVGIVADAHTRALTADPVPVLYLYYGGATNVARTMTLIVRAHGDPASVVSTTKSVLREVDPEMTLYNARPLREIIDASIAQPRLITLLLGVFAGMALLLAAMGIYGVVSFSVAQRTREIGVRMALGAREQDVLRLVLREGALMAVVGVVAGLVAAFAATAVIQSWLFGVERSDPVTLGTAAAALIGVALAASYLPARRAAKVDPLLAMRVE